MNIDQNITVALPSLIHRVGGETVQSVKQLALKHECELKRVRRSRHWQVSGDAINIQALCSELSQQPDSVLFFIKKLNLALQLHQDKLESPADRLKRLLTENPNMTLSELMEMTHCSVAEARRARFEVDEFESFG
ncbi:ribosome recycling factor [Vibrio breoganii]|uniref:ribosome recycling factor family protein n=1 Tax=Vibrio breoganii TaxID=553239 RepID=UPI000C858912|nr:ribosome recycling factor family protein [Vibrio breoganii]PMG90476.1 ribosome recycling factor [Vibrio breoganii]PML39231.1 ribosome recycling factor [Vibrio breoganii]PMM09271.1 ribosome recycling factor [Vibrio breoganii]